MATNRKNKLQSFKTVFWVLYILLFAFFYWVLIQLRIGSGVPDDFLITLMIVLAGSFATIVMIILGIIAGLFATLRT